MRPPRPAVLGGSLHSKNDAVAKRWAEGFPICPIAHEFRGLEGVSSTAIAPQAPIFSLDLDARITSNSPLTYRIVHNWVIAAHRSQGMMQLRANATDQEQYRFFALNDETEVVRCRRLFSALSGNAV